MKYTTLVMALLFSGSTLAGNSSQSGAVAGSASLGFNSQGVEVNFTSNGGKVDRADFSDRAPTVYAPGLTGGMNECIVSISGGASIGANIGAGISFGKAYVDAECQAMNAYTKTANTVSSKTEIGRLLIKHSACQSKYMWDNYEMTAFVTGDKGIGCPNTRPDGGLIEVRMQSANEPLAVQVVTMEGVPAVKYQAQGSDDDTNIHDYLNNDWD